MSLLSRKRKNEVIDTLIKEYPQAKCALDHESVFQLLIATVLSAQTTDASVNKVTPALFKKAPDAKRMARLSYDDAAQYIHSIGMYRQKAKHIVDLSKMLNEKYDGDVPQDFDALTSLPGVGRKTANVVLSVGFGEAHIAVDTHVQRLSNRIGLTETDNVLDTERALMKALPESKWTAAHHALIFHGRNVCSARNPKCEKCCIENMCKKNSL